MDAIGDRKLSDKEILALSLEKPSVFGVLVDRYQSAFLRTAGKILNHREEAEDAVQEAFMKIYLNAAKFREVEGASFKSWAYKIVVNTALTHYKKVKRTNDSIKYVDLEFYGAIADSSEDDRRVEAQIDAKMLIARILPNMPKHLQSTLKKYYLEDKSQKDIAAEENISVATVKMRVHRAKRKFKEILNKDNNLLCASRV